MMMRRILLTGMNLLLLLTCVDAYSTAEAQGETLPMPMNQAYLNICDTAQPAKEATDFFQTSYWQPSGRQVHISITIHPMDDTHCTSHKLPFAANTIEWAGLVPSTLNGKLDRGVILEGSRNQQNEFQIETISAMEEPKQEDESLPVEKSTRFHALPIGENLLGTLNHTVFGQEERVSLQMNGDVMTVRCHPGKLPAGVAFSKQNNRLSSRKPLYMLSTVTGQGNFRWNISDMDQASREHSVEMGHMNLLDKRETTVIPVNPEAADGKQWQSLALVCPLEEATITLYNLSFSTNGHLEKPLTRSTWIWKPESWQNDSQKIFGILEQWKINRVYITVPVNSQSVIEQRDKLKTFIQAATLKGIQVWAVDGERHALLPAEEPAFFQKVKAYHAYNQAYPPDARISGVQYDIEPYLMSGYSLASSQWNQRYVDFLKRAKQDSGLPIEIAVPFWFNQQKADNESFLDKAASNIDSLVIMDYRTDPRQIRQFAKPYFKWGSRYGKPVHVALETVPLSDTESAVYRHSKVGSLWLMPKNGQAVLIKLKETTNSVPEGRLYGYSHSNTMPGSDVTFFGKDDIVQRLLPELEFSFLQWDSFSGMAIHGLERE